MVGTVDGLFEDERGELLKALIDIEWNTWSRWSSGEEGEVEEGRGCEQGAI